MEDFENLPYKILHVDNGIATFPCVFDKDGIISDKCLSCLYSEDIYPLGATKGGYVRCLSHDCAERQLSINNAIKRELAVNEIVMPDLTEETGEALLKVSQELQETQKETIEKLKEIPQVLKVVNGEYTFPIVTIETCDGCPYCTSVDGELRCKKTKCTKRTDCFQRIIDDVIKVIVGNGDLDNGEHYEMVNSPKHYNTFMMEAYKMAEHIYGSEWLAIAAEITAFFYQIRMGTKPDNSTEQECAKRDWWIARRDEMLAKLPQDKVNEWRKNLAE